MHIPRIAPKCKQKHVWGPLPGRRQKCPENVLGPGRAPAKISTKMSGKCRRHIFRTFFLHFERLVLTLNAPWAPLRCRKSAQNDRKTLEGNGLSLKSEFLGTLLSQFSCVNTVQTWHVLFESSQSKCQSEVS